MAPTLELSVNGSAQPESRYLTWSPVPAQLRVVRPDPGGRTTVDVIVRNRTDGHGRVELRTTQTGAPSNRLTVSLPTGGAPQTFFLAGKWGAASVADKDAGVEVVDAATGTVLTSVPMMVRIRKDAEMLSRDERQRFLLALAQFNAHGTGKYQSFCDTHVEAAKPEAHGEDGFLPWHRAFLLDLERELQRIDPSVALPYWRFDKPAPSLFSEDFLGVADGTPIVRFARSNPLVTWSAGGQPGISREPQFDPAKSGARNGRIPVLNEGATVTDRNPYRTMRYYFENNPHGWAHSSFSGAISVIGTAPRDPLFFLLHSNVDRLWAKWQWYQRRSDVTSEATYFFRGSDRSPGAARIGHNLQDTMWPWNGVRSRPRPDSAPRPPFAPSASAPVPPPKPTVGSMIDYQNLYARNAGTLGFDYDDVPFEPA